MRETLARGGRACRPRIATPNLVFRLHRSRACLSWRQKGATIELGKRLRTSGDRPARKVLALEFPDATVPLNAGGHGGAGGAALGGEGTAARSFRAHRIPRHRQCAISVFPPPKEAPPILGVIGGTAEWIFSFEDRISVTVSGADAIVDRDREELARLFWRDVSARLAHISRVAALADREGKARHLRRHARTGHETAAHENRLPQSVAGGRLDRHRASRHPGGSRAFGRGGGGFGAQASGFIVRR